MEDRQPRARRKFTAEFKRDAVELVRATSKPIAEVARELSISDSTLAKWVKQDRMDRDEGSKLVQPEPAGREKRHPRRSAAAAAVALTGAVVAGATDAILVEAMGAGMVLVAGIAAVKALAPGRIVAIAGYAAVLLWAAEALVGIHGALFRYVLFVAAYIAWDLTVAGALAAQGKLRLPPASRVFLLPLVVGSWVVGMVFVWMLSGFWSLEIFAAFALAGFLAYLVATLLPLLLGQTELDDHTRDLAAVAVIESLRGHRILVSTIGWAQTILFLAYLSFGAVVVFFVTADDQAVVALQGTLLYLLLVSMFRMVFSPIQLSSEHLPQASREAVNITSFALLIPTLFIVGLLFSTFTPAFAEGEARLELSLWQFAGIVTLFIVTTGLPYITGRHRVQRLRASLLGQQREWLLQVQDVLERPTARLYEARLAESKAAVGQAARSFAANEKLITLFQAREDPVDRIVEEAPFLTELPNSESLLEGWKRGVAKTQRFSHYTWLRSFSDEIEEISHDLSGRPIEEREQAARAWADVLARRGEQVLQPAEPTENSRRLSGAFVTLGSLLVSAGVERLGSWLWDVFSAAR